MASSAGRLNSTRTRRLLDARCMALVTIAICDYCDGEVPPGKERDLLIPYPPEVRIGGRRRILCETCARTMKSLGEPEGRDAWKKIRDGQVEVIAAEQAQAAQEDADRAAAAALAEQQEAIRVEAERLTRELQQAEKAAELDAALTDEDPVARLSAAVAVLLVGEITEEERIKLERLLASMRD